MLNLRSPIVALVTPFDASGDIDWQAFKAYLSALYSWGVRAVIANGTTGEFPSLTLRERQLLIEFIREHFPGTIINNVSATCVSSVRESIASSRGCVDVVLLLPPYYYAACSNEGLCRFYVSALSGTPLPAMLYNFPQHTGNPLSPELVAMLIDQGIAIAGIKDSSGDLDNALAYKSRFPDIKIFFANDSQALNALQQGMAGLVSGGANPLPEVLLAMQAEWQCNGVKARALQRCIDVWNGFRENSGYFEIPLIKAALGARIADFPVHVRPPFMAVPAEEIQPIHNVINACLGDFKTIHEGHYSITHQTG